MVMVNREIKQNGKNECPEIDGYEDERNSCSKNVSKEKN